MTTHPPGAPDAAAPARMSPALLAFMAGGWALAGVLGTLLIVGSRLASPGSVPANPLGRESRSADQQPGVLVQLTGVNTAATFMTQLAAALKLPVHPHWEHMLLKPETPLRFDLPSADLATTFRLLNSQRSEPLGDVLEYRIFPDHAEIATVRYFDKQEMTSVNYDLASVVRAVQAAAEVSPPPAADQVVRTIIDTIESNVSFEDWMDNGGELAKVNLVGSGLLVSAPKRFHPQIAWVLEQIERTPGWTTGLQRLLAPAASAAAGIGGGGTGSGGAPAGNPASGTPGGR